MTGGYQCMSSVFLSSFGTNRICVFPLRRQVQIEIITNKNRRKIKVQKQHRVYTRNAYKKKHHKNSPKPPNSCHNTSKKGFDLITQNNDEE